MLLNELGIGTKVIITVYAKNDKRCSFITKVNNKRDKSPCVMGIKALPLDNIFVDVTLNNRNAAKRLTWKNEKVKLLVNGDYWLESDSESINTNRRDNVRVPYIDYIVIHGIECTTVNISNSGIAFKSNLVLNIGEVVTFRLQNELIIAKIVRYVENELYYAAQFEQDYKSIRDLVSCLQQDILKKRK